jgi:hypothetical protein
LDEQIKDGQQARPFLSQTCFSRIPGSITKEVAAGNEI